MGSLRRRLFDSVTSHNHGNQALPPAFFAPSRDPKKGSKDQAARRLISDQLLGNESGFQGFDECVPGRKSSTLSVHT